MAIATDLLGSCLFLFGFCPPPVVTILLGFQCSIVVCQGMFITSVSAVYVLLLSPFLPYKNHVSGGR